MVFKMSIELIASCLVLFCLFIDSQVPVKKEKKDFKNKNWNSDRKSGNYGDPTKKKGVVGLKETLHRYLHRSLIYDVILLMEIFRRLESKWESRRWSRHQRQNSSTVPS